jgi:fatty acid desaturase
MAAEAHRAAPRVLIAWALFDWAVIGAAWAAMALIDGPWIAVVGIVVVASRLHALGVILHDACHRRRRCRARGWRVVEALAGWPIASTIEAMRYHHLRHHAMSGTPTDPYHEPAHFRSFRRRHLLILRGALLPCWWTLRAVVAPGALLAPSFRTPYARAFLQDRSGRDLRHNAAVLACARADIVQLAAQSALLGSAFAAGLPVIIFYLLPLTVAGILNARRVIYEHAWVLNERRSRRQMWETTVDHDIGRIGNAIFYPHNIGIHRIHHLYPTVSFVHLRALAKTVQSGGPASDVELDGPAPDLAVGDRHARAHGLNHALDARVHEVGPCVAIAVRRRVVEAGEVRAHDANVLAEHGSRVGVDQR